MIRVHFKLYDREGCVETSRAYEGFIPQKSDHLFAGTRRYNVVQVQHSLDDGSVTVVAVIVSEEEEAEDAEKVAAEVSCTRCLWFGKVDDMDGDYCPSCNESLLDPD